MKTIKEWLETLPEPYRAQALKNIAEHPFDDKTDLTTPVESLAEAIDSFEWFATEEGHDYWEELYEKQKL